MIQKEKNNTWVRIINSCNSRCLFCLDSDSQKNGRIDSGEIEENIRSGIRSGYFNKIIISGGEASIHPDFFFYLNFAKECGYDRIQTITNGQRFSDDGFCKKVVESGLQEVTFSIHGHNPKLHDHLTGIQGSFEKSLRGIINFKKNHPQVILNIDIVMNKINIRFIPDIISFFMKLGIYEFDLLQIIPFGRTLDYADSLLYDPKNHPEIFKRIGELSKIPGMHIWTNRLPPELLEGSEHLIQDPDKLRSEILGEGRDMFEKAFNSRSYPDCHGEKCRSCFIEDFCRKMKNRQVSKENARLDLNNIDRSAEFIYLGGENDIKKINSIYGRSGKDFAACINSIQLNGEQRLLNVPKCIRNENNDSVFICPDAENLDSFVECYIGDIYRKKSLRCMECKHDEGCEGLHIGFIKAYGFGILKPIS